MPPELPQNVLIRTQMLPATNGDCLVVTTPGPTRPFRMLIDAGATAATLAALVQRVQRIPRDADGRRNIDLLVVTHLDSDHIGNIAEFLYESPGLDVTFGDIWFNGWDVVAPYLGTERGLVASITEADEVSEAIIRLGLPNNLAFGGGAAVVSGPRPWMPIAPRAGWPQLTLIAPQLTQMRALARDWQRTAKKLRARESDDDGLRTLTAAARPPLGPPEHLDVAVLGRSEPGRDPSPPNGSSIAFALQSVGATAVYTGDSHVGVYDVALQLWLDQPHGPGAVDLIKLPHHGSRNNTHSRLANAGAHVYLVSTDSSRHHHPDDETFARLIVGRTGEMPRFVFNYDNDHLRRWTRVPAQWRPKTSFGNGTIQTMDLVRADR